MVAAFWIHDREGGEELTSRPVNRLLTDLGHKIPNITDAIDALKDTTPALAIQLRKHGKSRQAQNRFKLSEAGRARVHEMLEAASASE